MPTDGLGPGGAKDQPRRAAASPCAQPCMRHFCVSGPPTPAPHRRALSYWVNKWPRPRLSASSTSAFRCWWLGRTAFSPTPYGVAIGLQTAGNLRPRQTRLLLEPPQPFREVVGDDVGSSTVTCALSAWRRHSLSTAVGPLLGEGRGLIPVWLIPPWRSRYRSEPPPRPSVHKCLLFSLPPTGPAR